MATLTMRTEPPRFNTALGAAEETLVNVPPFTFPGVTARVFPLRANINLLRAFCRSYLNVAPELYEFSPALPCVFLVVLDYGRLGIEQFNLGWVSQHEVLFEVPLGKWRIEGKRRIFENWVVNTPFIVVDNAISLTTGRETYGWPKVLATLETSPERWLTDPRNATRFLTLDVKGLDSDNPNVRLLEIEQQTGQNAALFPPDLGMLDPFGRLSRLTRNAMTLGFDMTQLLLGAPLAGFAPRRPGERGELLSEGLRRLAGFYVDPGVDVVTLKQFRDSYEPDQICYQALVTSRLSVARFNGGGLLGLYNFAQGDLTGGFRIRLFDTPGFPIVEALGLEVAEERTVRGRAVSILEPIYPYWQSVDLNYGRGTTLCCRTLGSPWQRGRTPAPPVAAGLQRPKAFYNTVAGGAEQVWRGPFLVPDGSYDVYPLRARPDRLQAFLERYLASDGRLQVSPITDGDRAHVYMVASANHLFSQARSGACIVATQIDFYVPLHLSIAGDVDEGCRQEFDVLVTPFSFVDNPVLATTLREVQGIPAINATINAPSRFMRGDRPMLTMAVDVFKALGAGLRGESQTLLEVVPGTPDAPAPATPFPFFDPFVDSQVSRRPVLKERLMLKQFRDADEPDRACYQSLVLEPWFLTSAQVDLKQLQHDMKIRIYRYPSLPLVETLGLIADEVLFPTEPEGAIADVFTPDWPYRIKLGLEIGLGREISHAAGLLPWIHTPPRESAQPSPKVSPGSTSPQPLS